MKKLFRAVLGVAVLGVLVNSCATRRKLSAIQEQSLGAAISLSRDAESYVPEVGAGVEDGRRDTIEVQDLDGRKVLLMKAVRDETTGEMVAQDVIDAAVVTARFRNVAERRGKVDLAFQVTVPESMQDSRWQLRFYPDMFVMGDSLRLEPVIITGSAYRKAQLKGYQQYNRFLSRIVSDTTKFINVRQLELFLKRNIPQLYAFKTDSTEVSDEAFLTCFGVSEQTAVDHYTHKFAKRRNERRKARIGEMYRRYVKAPIVTDNIRLDTVMVARNGDFIYNYVQTLNTRPKLRKADIVLSGAIFEQDRRLYTIPRSEPLTFYISSVSAFTRNTQRYLTRVVERRVEANTEGRIDFEIGRWEVKPELGSNASEIGYIKANLASLIENETFDLDSIVVSATASPDGSLKSNGKLAQRRSESVSEYFRNYIRTYTDSLRNADGVFMVFGKDARAEHRKYQRIRLEPRCIPENWDDLNALVEADTVLTAEEKETYRRIVAEEEDPDVRERRLRSESWSGHLKEDLYPQLRTVKFNFYLHRKGMVKDTVHTTVPDSVYLRGVTALKDMDYGEALECLAPYRDFNTAVAYLGLDRNRSALEILSGLEPDDRVHYLMAIVCSRLGNDKEAVRHYVAACRENRTLVHRGNLDPEISVLIKRYSLGKLFEEQLDN